jgi:hypothetical protein
MIGISRINDGRMDQSLISERNIENGTTARSKKPFMTICDEKIRISFM